MRDSTAGQRKGQTSPYHKDRSDIKNKEVKWGRKEGRTHISNLPYPRESTGTRDRALLTYPFGQACPR